MDGEGVRKHKGKKHAPLLGSDVWYPRGELGMGVKKRRSRSKGGEVQDRGSPGIFGGGFAVPREPYGLPGEGVHKKRRSSRMRGGGIPELIQPVYAQPVESLFNRYAKHSLITNRGYNDRERYMAGGEIAGIIEPSYTRPVESLFQRYAKRSLITSRGYDDRERYAPGTSSVPRTASGKPLHSKYKKLNDRFMLGAGVLADDWSDPIFGGKVRKTRKPKAHFNRSSGQWVF